MDERAFGDGKCAVANLKYSYFEVSIHGRQIRLILQAQVKPHRTATAVMFIDRVIARRARSVLNLAAWLIYFQPQCFQARQATRSTNVH